VRLDNQAKAVLSGNTIIANDLSGITVIRHSSIILTCNTITNNGHCAIERTAAELSSWPQAAVVAYSSTGFPGVKCREHSTLTMTNDSNTIEDNGKGNGAEQIATDNVSRQTRSPHYFLILLVTAYVIYRSSTADE
jgi:parallel beta-helix repeat protein